MTVTINNMISEFICCGCVAGNDTETCEEFKFHQRGCANHSMGTSVFGTPGHFALGLPKGFCKPGYIKFGTVGKPTDQMFIHCYVSMEDHNTAMGEYDKFNVPVWALEKDGYLFIRVYRPRINQTLVDVIKGATVSQLPDSVIDVVEFYDEID